MIPKRLDVLELMLKKGGNGDLQDIINDINEFKRKRGIR
ncbi:hypothetical protein AO364_0739 [Moraxella catarrhalis]|nr:hypothetical protein AO364_0739 [Moraxella catarrhalis]